MYEALTRRSWPGNVRELKNVVERAAILSSERITIADLPEDPHASPFDDDDGVGARPSRPPELPGVDGETRLTLRAYREVAERSYILQTLRDLDWNISKSAVALGVERTNLHKKIRAFGIKRGD